jgi:3-oxoadipate enol-lactonase
MKIRLPEFVMAYEDYGQGVPILFIHGYPLNRKLWEPQFKGFADIARVLAPDLRGHGESDSIAGIYTMELLADDCNAFLDALGVTQPVFVCGLSMGGYVTFAFYRKYTHRVAGLILTATRAGADSPEVKANRDKAISLAQQAGPDAIAESMLPKMLAPETYITKPDLVEKARKIMGRTSITGIIGDLNGMKERPDSTSTLPLIKKPTLIVHGANDQLISHREAEAMYTGIKTSRLLVLNGAGHLLNLEQSALFNQAIRDFILQGSYPQ